MQGFYLNIDYRISEGEFFQYDSYSWLGNKRPVNSIETKITDNHYFSNYLNYSSYNNNNKNNHNNNCKMISISK